MIEGKTLLANSLLQLLQTDARCLGRYAELSPAGLNQLINEVAQKILRDEMTAHSSASSVHGGPEREAGGMQIQIETVVKNLFAGIARQKDLFKEVFGEVCTNFHQEATVLNYDFLDWLRDNPKYIPTSKTKSSWGKLKRIVQTPQGSDFASLVAEMDQHQQLKQFHPFIEGIRLFISTVAEVSFFAENYPCVAILKSRNGQEIIDQRIYIVFVNNAVKGEGEAGEACQLILSNLPGKKK